MPSSLVENAIAMPNAAQMKSERSVRVLRSGDGGSARRKICVRVRERERKRIVRVNADAKKRTAHSLQHVKQNVNLKLSELPDARLILRGKLRSKTGSSVKLSADGGSARRQIARLRREKLLLKPPPHARLL
jgi:hypothetical protein